MKTIICADALVWLAGQADIGAIVTSLPDAEEIGGSLDTWRPWFSRAALACMTAASPGQACVFYQTDRKADGHIESKAAMLFEAAARARLKPLWHKIVIRRGVGKIDIHRPGFTHLIAFSESGKPGKATPDVMEAGHMLYPNAMGLSAASAAVQFAGFGAGKGGTIVDPFCGRGTICAVAEAMGFNTVGIDIDPKQCELAKALSLRLKR